MKPYKIVHSSATYIQNLNTIRVVSKKLLTIKSVKCLDLDLYVPNVKIRLLRYQRVSLGTCLTK